MIEIRPGDIRVDGKGEIIIGISGHELSKIREFKETIKELPESCTLLKSKMAEIKLSFIKFTEEEKKFFHSLADNVGEAFDETVIGRGLTFDLIEAVQSRRGRHVFLRS